MALRRSCGGLAPRKPVHLHLNCDLEPFGKPCSIDRTAELLNHTHVREARTKSLMVRNAWNNRSSALRPQNGDTLTNSCDFDTNLAVVR